MARYPKIDLVDLAEKLESWCQLDDSYSLMGFCADHDISQTFLYDIAAKDPNFVECLQVATAKLGTRRERKAAESKVPMPFYGRAAGQYDKGLRMYEKMMAKFDHDIKAAAQAPAPPRDEILAAQNENMLLRHEIHSLKEQIKLQNEIDNS